MTIRRRLLFTFLLLGILPSAIVAGVASWSAIRMARGQVEDMFFDDLDLLSTLMHAELHGSREYLRWVARMSMITSVRSESHLQRPLASRSPGPAMASAVFANTHEGEEKLLLASRLVLIEPGREYASIQVRDWSGHRPSARDRVLLGDLPPEYLAPLTDPSFVDAGRGLVVTRRSTGSVLGVLAIIQDETGALAYVSVAEFPMNAFLLTCLRRVNRESLANTFVAARDGATGDEHFLHHPDPTMIGMPVDRDPAWRLVPLVAGADADSKGGSRRDDGPRATRNSDWSTRRSGDTFRAARTDPVTGWIVGNSISLRPGLAPVRQSIALFLGFFGLMSIVVAAGILRATRGVSTAVETIADRTSAIARGDFGSSLDIRRSDEFGTIAEHINRMADDLLITSESRSIATTHARLMHDLKGLLYQMQLLLYNLRENDDDPEFRAESVDMMSNMIGEVERVVLQLRRSDVDTTINRQLTDVDALIHSVIDSPLVTTHRDVVPELTLSAGIGETDPELLAGILENVVGNALDAMPSGGTLRVVSTRDEQSGADEIAATQTIEIQDTGMGMTRAFIERDLFRPFVTTKERGTGLGMYTAKRLAERLGTSIHVDSVPGNGTCITLTLERIEDPSS